MRIVVFDYSGFLQLVDSYLNLQLVATMRLQSVRVACAIHSFSYTESHLQLAVFSSSKVTPHRGHCPSKNHTREFLARMVCAWTVSQTEKTSHK